MRILALENPRPGAKQEDFAPHLRSEARAVWELEQADVVREVYFTEAHDAVLILECASVEDARAALSTLPLVKADVVSFTLIPLKPYDGYQRLFEKP
jgi:hypothetical protein